MRHWGRYRLASLIAIVTCTAVVLGLSANRHEWLTVAVIEIIAGLCILEVLVRNIPTSLKDSQYANCVRQDGTWSKRRERIELRSLRTLRFEMAKTLLLVGLITNVLFGFVHSEVIPIPLGIEAVAEFDPSQEVWRDNLASTRQRFESWARQKASPSDVSARKQLLWQMWPFIIGGIVIWFLVIFAFIGRSYYHALSALSASIRFRSQRYALRELHEAIGTDHVAEDATGLEMAVRERAN